MNPAQRDDEALDLLLRGRIALWQRKKGYRTSIDATLLAYFAASLGPRSTVVDMCAGSGLVSILMLRRFGDLRATLVELQPGLAAAARKNAILNGVAERCQVVLHDLADGVPGLAVGAELVVCNPPFFTTEGRIVPADEERRTAHYETTADIFQLAACARTLLARDGAALWVYPNDGRSRLLDALVAAGLTHCEVTPIEHRPGHRPITRCLVLARSSTTAKITVQPALHVHPADCDDSRYSDAIEAFLCALGPLPSKIGAGG